jgi:hypothetical protein
MYKHLAFIIVISLYVSSCTLQQDSTRHHAEIYHAMDVFTQHIKRGNLATDAVMLPAKKVQGDALPYDALKYLVGVRRIFYITDTLQDDSLSMPSFSIHALTFENRRRALKVWKQFCNEPEWIENQLLSRPGFVFLRHNIILHINAEPGLDSNTWKSVLQHVGTAFPEKRMKDTYYCHFDF